MSTNAGSSSRSVLWNCLVWTLKLPILKEVPRGWHATKEVSPPHPPLCALLWLSSPAYLRSCRRQRKVKRNYQGTQLPDEQGTFGDVNSTLIQSAWWRHNSLCRLSTNLFLPHENKQIIFYGSVHCLSNQAGHGNHPSGSHSKHHETDEALILVFNICSTCVIQRSCWSTQFDLCRD